MRVFYLVVFMLFSSYLVQGQHIIIEEGKGVGTLKLGQSFEEVVNILGFGGDLKTYDDYLAEELFNEDPEIALECVLGFEYYVKYTHLLILPVSYVFFKNNAVSQIMVSSFPEYYFSIAKDSKTKKGLEFWAENNRVINVYGNPDLKVNYEGFILNAYFYFDQGITIDLRENNFRAAHIYARPEQALVKKFVSEF
jgi:hypothetical protein